MENVQEAGPLPLALWQRPRFFLELVDQTGHDFNRGGFTVKAVVVGAVVLRISRRGVDRRTLREAVVVTDGNVPTGQAAVLMRSGPDGIALGFRVHVADGGLGRSAESGNADADRDAVALGVVKILSHAVELHEAKVVVAAEGDRVLIILRIRLRGVPVRAGVVDKVNNAYQVEAVVVVGRGNTVVAVGIRLAFRTVVVGVGLERILSMNLETSPVGRDVGHRVVETAPTIGGHEFLTNGVTPTRGEGRGLTEKTVRAVGARKLTDAAKRKGTEIALQVDLGFTTEDAAVVTEVARIGIKAVFQNKADRKAIAEVFGTLDAEARAGIHTGTHFETVSGVDVSRVTVNMLIVEAVVDQTVDRHVGGNRSAGHGAHRSEGNKSFLHGRISENPNDRNRSKL